MGGNISRSRGYSFENALVHKLVSFGWYAKRLGGTSTEFPDIVATNKIHSMLVALEAKAYSSQKIYIPIDQYHRCFSVCEMFDIYEKRLAVFAFKFNRITGIRKVKYYFGIIAHEHYLNNKEDLQIICDYDKGITTEPVNKVLIDFFDLVLIN